MYNVTKCLVQFINLGSLYFLWFVSSTRRMLARWTTEQVLDMFSLGKRLLGRSLDGAYFSIRGLKRSIRDFFWNIAPLWCRVLRARRAEEPFKVLRTNVPVICIQNCASEFCLFVFFLIINWYHYYITLAYMILYQMIIKAVLGHAVGSIALTLRSSSLPDSYVLPVSV